MRILGVSKKWDKLKQPEWTTFRFPRKDRDWQMNEPVQVVFKPRSKEREILGIATIIEKYAVYVFPNPIPDPICPIGSITEEDAINDGFQGLKEMQLWFWDTYKREAVNSPINKLTLIWQETAGALSET